MHFLGLGLSAHALIDELSNALTDSLTSTLAGARMKDMNG